MIYPFQSRATYKIILTNNKGEINQHYAIITEVGTYIYDHIRNYWEHFSVLPKYLQKQVIKEIMDIEKEMSK